MTWVGLLDITSDNYGTKNRIGTLDCCRGKNTKVIPERIV
jgi:hypothetical protein